MIYHTPINFKLITKILVLPKTLSVLQKKVNFVSASSMCASNWVLVNNDFMLFISGNFCIEHCRTSILLCRCEDRERKAAQTNDHQLNGRATRVLQRTRVSIKCDMRMQMKSELWLARSTTLWRYAFSSLNLFLCSFPMIPLQKKIDITLYSLVSCNRNAFCHEIAARSQPNIRYLTYLENNQKWLGSDFVLTNVPVYAQHNLWSFCSAIIPNGNPTK